MDDLSASLREAALGNAPGRLRGWWLRLVRVIGPGFVVMLADTDAGSVITAAQSGAQWGYRLLLLQVLLIPVLYVVQELAVRLGLYSGKGFGELIGAHFGRGLSRVIMAALMLSCLGALVTQMSGIAGIAELFGIPVWQTVSAQGILIFLMVVTGSYHTIERLAVILGLFEFAFFIVAWKSAPVPHDVFEQMVSIPLGDASFLLLTAANLGTCLIPWAVAYQQSATVDKGLTLDDAKVARIDTLLGATFCQAVTAAVLIAGAASLHAGPGSPGLQSIAQIGEAFTHALGPVVGHWVFAIGLFGGASVATIVVCLTAAWSLGEFMGRRHSLEHHPKDAPWFYGAFVIMLIASSVIVSSGTNLVDLSIAMGVVNAILMPLILWCVYRLCRSALPAPHRLRGGYAVVVALLFLASGGLGLFSSIAGALG